MLDWSAQLLGLPAGWHGHIEDSASIATMAALIAARETTGRDLVLCSEQAHSSVQKGARMAGMRLRKVAVDDRQRMRTGDLADLERAAADRRHRRDHGEHRGRRRRDDRRPMRADRHVDARRRRVRRLGDGLPGFRWAFAGIERADSLVVNAHKWMLNPNDCSLLWSRRPRTCGPRSA